MTMNIATQSVNLNQAKIQMQAQTSVMKMAMDTSAQSLDLINQMLPAVKAVKPANMIKTRPGNMLHKVL